MKDTWNALVRFCSYQERCRNDVMKKMKTLNLAENEYSKWITKLEAENFLNEIRFVSSFVNGRFKNKNWGIAKIKRELQLRGINAPIIEKIISEEIETSDYQAKIIQLASKKWQSIKTGSIAERKLKLQKYLMAKGFHFQEIKEAIQSDIFR
jgi:regulatory protein